jgi:hypothetical protein
MEVSIFLSIGSIKKPETVDSSSIGVNAAELHVSSDICIFSADVGGSIPLKELPDTFLRA